VVHVEKGDTALSHRSTVPTRPEMVSVAAVDPVQIGAAPVMVPPIVPVVTVTIVESLPADAHVPLCTTALKAVDAVNAPEE
jgi:hypothetical protein